MSLQDEIDKLKQIPDDARAQAKLDLMILLMEGETANFAASIYVPFLAGFAIAVGNTGIDPMATIAQLSHHTRLEIRRQLKGQGISTKRPLDG